MGFLLVILAEITAIFVRAKHLLFSPAHIQWLAVPSIYTGINFGRFVPHDEYNTEDFEKAIGWRGL